MIDYKPRIFDNLLSSPFAGPASPLLDQSWNSLLADINIRVSARELSIHDQVSVPLPENGGQLAWLGVFHELHYVVSVNSALEITSKKG